MNYEPLPIEVTQNGGHHYRQVWRDDYAAVYEQRNAFGAFLGYEAIAIKRAGPCHAFGKDYPARELYPCNEDWGKLAISVSDLDRAMDAANDFSQRAKKREGAREKGPTGSIRQPQKSGTHRSASASSVDTRQFRDRSLSRPLEPERRLKPC
jgi:hypothetical protein